jgi:hypothetical protein
MADLFRILCIWIAGVGVGWILGTHYTARIWRKRRRREAVPAEPAGASLDGYHAPDVPRLTYPFVEPRRPPRYLS